MSVGWDKVPLTSPGNARGVLLLQHARLHHQKAARLPYMRHRQSSIHGSASVLGFRSSCEAPDSTLLDTGSLASAGVHDIEAPLEGSAGREVMRWEYIT